MNTFKEDRKKAYKTARILTFCLIIGIPCVVMGGVFLKQSKGFIALLIVGIAGVVSGFYGSPIAWVHYGDFSLYGRIIMAVENEHFYSVEEMSKYLRRPKTVISNALNKCVDKLYLTGYKFDGKTLTLNENEKLAPTEHSVICSYCGALVNFTGSVTTCPYCNAIVKYEVPQKETL